jgi:O-antigen/teichoic acid export membrane protein
MKFIVSLMEQGFGSILTFAINLWLIRNGATESYGVYVFWLSVAWVLGTAQGTLVIAHMYRLPSAFDRMEERRQPERLLLSFALGISLLAALGVVVGDWVLGRIGSELASPGAVLFIPAFLMFQYVRAFSFSRQRPMLATCLTGGILAAAIVLLGGDYLLGFRPDAERVLFLTAASYGGVSLAVLFVLLRGMLPMLDLAEIRRYAVVMRGSGWLALGAASGEVTNRLYSFAVVGRFGTGALATLSAVQVVIRPAWMLSAAWQSIGYPRMAACRAEGDRAGFLRIMLTGATLSTAGSFVWTALVLAGWPWISGELYHGGYTEIGPLVYYWGANVMLGSIAAALNVGLLAVGEFKPLALVDLAGAMVTSLAIFGLLARFDYTSAVLATMLGQTTQIVLMAVVLQRRLRQPLAVAT